MGCATASACPVQHRAFTGDAERRPAEDTAVFRHSLTWCSAAIYVPVKPPNHDVLRLLEYAGDISWGKSPRCALPVRCERDP